MFNRSFLLGVFLLGSPNIVPKLGFPMTQVTLFTLFTDEMRHSAQDPLVHTFKWCGRQMMNLRGIRCDSFTPEKINDLAKGIFGAGLLVAIAPFTVTDMGVRFTLRQLTRTPRSYPAAQRMFDNVFLGDRRAINQEFLDRFGVQAVLSVDYSMPQPGRPLEDHLLLESNDRPDDTIEEILERGVTFLEEQLTAGRSTLVHCSMGQSRSASVIIAYLIRNRGYSFERAHRYVKHRRPVIDLNDCYIRALRKLTPVEVRGAA